MNLIDLPIEDLELSDHYKDWNIHSLFRNPTGAILIIKHKQKEEYGALFLNERGCWPSDKHQCVLRKPIKKTFIKTLKELVNSGWDLRVGRSMTCLVHPDTVTTFNFEMLRHCGEERATVERVCEQNKWHWTPEMLIEKEV